MAIDSGASLQGRRPLGAGSAARCSAATAAGLWWQLFRRPLPKTGARIAVARARAARSRSAAIAGAMPHIRANAPHDLWFGQGFCHGQDRLWQCELYRAGRSGRLSEIAGDEGLEVDRLMRTLGLRRRALREEAELDPDVRSPARRLLRRASTQAAAAASAPLPAEFQMLRLDFEPWRPADMLAGAKLLSFGLSTNWERELLRADLVRELGPELAAQDRPRLPDGQPGRASARRGLHGRRRSALAEQIGQVRGADRAGRSPPAGPTTGR